MIYISTFTVLTNKKTLGADYLNSSLLEIREKKKSKNHSLQRIETVQASVAACANPKREAGVWQAGRLSAASNPSITVRD